MKIVEGKFNGPEKALEDTIFSISIDSRTINKDDLYIAIEGVNFDGNHFVKNAMKNGAKFSIVSDPEVNYEGTILVSSGRESLIKIASRIREKFQPKVIAITGSNGKTTTKEIIVSILKNYCDKEQILFTKGNFNNDIGLPLTMLDLNKSHKYVVLELGMNHAGEIADLSKIAQPHVAVITNIGEAHIENFKSKYNIAEAKKEILSHSSKLEFAVLPGDDYYFTFLNEGGSNLNKVTFGSLEESTISYKALEDRKIKIVTPKESFNVKINLLGTHNLQNVLAACACCYSLGIPVHAIKIGIEEIKPFPGRLETIGAVKGATVIDDSYNANPSSMKEAIDVLLSMKGTRILVIGDMAELGDDTNKYHQELGDYIQASKIDFTLAIGRHTKLTMQQLGKKEFWFDSKDALVSKLLKVMDSKSTVLVKGSRFMKMEDIVNKLKAEK